MTCPDWSRLTADPGTPVPAEAWAHAEACTRCRRAAVAAEPTLIFRHLPETTVTDDDIESMRVAVHAMRRERERSGAAQSRERVGVLPFGGSRAPVRWAALAAAAILAILLPIADLTPRVASPVVAEAETLPPWLDELLADQPLVDVGEAHNVTQLDTADLSLVVISVDDLEVASLDV